MTSSADADGLNLRDSRSAYPVGAPQVLATVDTLSAQRRPLTDRLGWSRSCSPRRWSSLARSVSWPSRLLRRRSRGRYLLVHLLWYRRLGMDLTRPPGYATLLT